MGYASLHPSYGIYGIEAGRSGVASNKRSISLPPQRNILRDTPPFGL